MRRLKGKVSSTIAEEWVAEGDARDRGWRESVAQSVKQLEAGVEDIAEARGSGYLADVASAQNRYKTQMYGLTKVISKPEDRLTFVDYILALNPVLKCGEDVLLVLYENAAQKSLTGENMHFLADIARFGDWITDYEQKEMHIAAETRHRKISNIDANEFCRRLALSYKKKPTRRGEYALEQRKKGVIVYASSSWRHMLKGVRSETRI